MRSSLHRSTRPAAPAVRPLVPATSSAIAAAIASFTLVPATSFAQAADSGTAQQLAPVVVTSTRTAQSITEALPHTTVVTQEDIVNSQAPDLRTLLRNQAGVELTANGGMGTNTSLFMRGANSNQTLILIDGVRVSSVSSGTAQLANILPDQIDRIEVVRGNVSALYGSDAIGGVVQIFTKSGAGQAPAANASVEYGSNNTRQGTVGYGGQVGDTSFNLTGSAFKTDGFSSINTQQAPRANPNDNPYENQSVSGQVKHRFTPDWDAGFSGYYSKSKLSFDSAFGRPTADLQRAVLPQLRPAQPAAGARQVGRGGRAVHHRHGGPAARDRVRDPL
ncbi:Vitamin B12 transporter BtuB [compost metagenome]